uniref:Uncharacterized protein n=1 Tax=Aegilops tauschii subsp. strangulata TaxID=200361 RepID=A0A453MRS1_AEGTS
PRRRGARRRTCSTWCSSCRTGASATRSPRPPGATSPTRSPRSTSTRMAATGRRGGFGTRPGVQVADAPIKLSGVNKRGWKYIKASQKTVQDIPAAETPAAATATATATA